MAARLPGRCGQPTRFHHPLTDMRTGARSTGHLSYWVTCNRSAKPVSPDRS